MAVRTVTPTPGTTKTRLRGQRAEGAGGDPVWLDHALLSFFVFFWAGNFVLAELALVEMMPISFSAARLLAGGASMLILLHLQLRFDASRNRGSTALFRTIRREDWPRLLLVSVLGATLAPWLGIEGLNLTHSGRAALWLALGPALSCGIGYLWRSESVGWVGWLGTVLAGLGTLVLALEGVRNGGAVGRGDLFLFMSLLLTVVELHLARPLVDRYGPTFTVAARTAIGGILYLLIASPALAAVSWISLNGWTWVAILIGGGVGVGMGQWVKVRAVRVLGPTRVILYGNLVPLVTLAVAWLVIDNQPSIVEIVAGALILLGALCLQVFDGVVPRAAAPKTAPSVAEAVMEDL